MTCFLTRRGDAGFVLRDVDNCSFCVTCFLTCRGDVGFVLRDVDNCFFCVTCFLARRGDAGFVLLDVDNCFFITRVLLGVVDRERSVALGDSVFCFLFFGILDFKDIFPLVDLKNSHKPSRFILRISVLV